MATTIQIDEQYFKMPDSASVEAVTAVLQDGIVNGVGAVLKLDDGSSLVIPPAGVWARVFDKKPGRMSAL